MSSSEFKTFVNTNNLRRKLLQIGKDNAHEEDIGKLVFTIFKEFKLQLPNDLQIQIESIFGMLIKNLNLVTKTNCSAKRRQMIEKCWLKEAIGWNSK